MLNEYYYRDMGVFSRSHPFGEQRQSARFGSYFHAGIDWTSTQNKNQDIYNLIAGVIEDIGSNRDYGNYVKIKHNAKYLKGADSDFYSLYCHLSEIDEDVERIFRKTSERFIKAGEILGKMGNTGNCLTWDKKGWRILTDEEVSSKFCMRGVHLHQQFYQRYEGYEETFLIKDMLDKKVCDKNDLYFVQWNKIMIWPDALIKYFMRLQGRRIS